MPASSAVPFPGLNGGNSSVPASGCDTADASPQPETPNRILGAEHGQKRDSLLTAEDVAQRLNVTKDWVWDHSSRKAPYLPVIRMGDGNLRYRASRIEEFIDQRERLTQIRRKRA
jgi:predicted DNA-binding transcriptional regulator AlpA